MWIGRPGVDDERYCHMVFASKDIMMWHQLKHDQPEDRDRAAFSLLSCVQSRHTVASTDGLNSFLSHYLHVELRNCDVVFVR